MLQSRYTHPLTIVIRQHFKTNCSASSIRTHRLAKAEAHKMRGTPTSTWGKGLRLNGQNDGKGDCARPQDLWRVKHRRESGLTADRSPSTELWIPPTNTDASARNARVRTWQGLHVSGRQQPGRHQRGRYVPVASSFGDSCPSAGVKGENVKQCRPL